MKFSARPPAALSRRRFITSLIGASCAAQTRAYAQTPQPTVQLASSLPARLIISGAQTSEIGTFGTVISSTLAPSLGFTEGLRLKYDLGHDGVTAANLFDRNTPDDATDSALLSKGLAIIAALCDDARVHFDYSRWIGILVAQQSVVTIARVDLPRTFRTRVSGLLRDKPLHVAVTQPIGEELPTVLGLSLLGLRPLPISGFTSSHKALAALGNGSVDAIQLSITSDADRALLKTLPDGTAPLFGFGNHALGIKRFEDAFHEMHGRAPISPLYHGWHALGAAAATPLLIGLPMLTPPVAVARWRYAITASMSDRAIKDWFEQYAMTAEAGVAASKVMGQFTPELTALLALRRWINLNVPRWRLGQESKRLL